MMSHDPNSPEPDDAAVAPEARRPLPISAVAAVAGAAVVAVMVLVFAFAGGPSTDESDFRNLAFTTIDGSTGSLADYVGEQPLVVNFFASWCAPCRAELPDLEQVHLARQGSVVFLGVNHDLDESTWRSFVDETEITFETVFQPRNELFTALDGKGMPTTAFIASDGEVRHVHTGLLTDDLLEDLIDEHLGAT